MRARATPSERRRLRAIAGPCRSDQQARLEPLLAGIRARFGARLLAVVYYGACLRGGDPFAGLVDFYVIVDACGPPGQSRLGGWCNRVLPPSVYYAEAGAQHATLRCKYAVLSAAQLEAGAARWFHSAVWGRFAQPVAIVHARDDATRERVRAACGAAVVTLLEHALPALDDDRPPAEVFAAALSLSYASELRVERAGRSARITADTGAEYARRAASALPALTLDATLDNGRLRWQTTRSQAVRARRMWRLRRACGKALSLARLVKACFTFRGAIDYATYKIERHTGVAIEVNDRLRRHPLIFGWAALWRVYRQRLLR